MWRRSICTRWRSCGSGALPDPWPPDFAGRDALEWYDEARAAIVDALEAAGTGLETWTFNPDDKTSGFWYRRMALESVVHRIDVEQAHDVVTPIDPELALDGIDELLYPNLAGPWWEEGDTDAPRRRRRAHHGRRAGRGRSAPTRRVSW